MPQQSPITIETLKKKGPENKDLLPSHFPGSQHFEWMQQITPQCPTHRGTAKPVQSDCSSIRQ